ncbi:MAG: radical SAM family heme chaperone HemW [Oscillospiraceae bacterium]|nr:radical SAM family heme chaperone HemW [Oscillospiraceae bacterium]
MTGIYIHIPFCARKCPYCDFYSVSYRKSLAEDYVQAVIRNLHHYQISDSVDSIYFGGGTPSLLSVKQISEILETCSKNFKLASPEITLEYNLTRTDGNHLHELYQAGINRLSVGTQSFSDSQLNLLGRTHTAGQNLETIRNAEKAGFRNISCDLMLALPYQTEEILSETLDILISLPIQHVSAYLLQMEEHTPFYTNREILDNLPDDDVSADRYLQTVHTLEDAGFQQYEVSSFAKTGFESRHNLKYWFCEEYLGIGAGAHSCMKNRRFCIPRDADLFCKSPVQKEITIAENACDDEERLMLALRTARGVPESAFSTNARRKFPILIKNNYIRKNSENQICLTPEGFAVSNAVISMLLE